MEKCIIMSVPDKSQEYLIIANTYENPINDFLSEGYVPAIENGDVIFDLAIINGMNFNRFISATVRNHRLLVESIKPTSSINDKILGISRNYFQKNRRIVEQSVLPSAVKYLLVNSEC